LHQPGDDEIERPALPEVEAEQRAQADRYGERRHDAAVDESAALARDFRRAVALVDRQQLLTRLEHGLV
jgi:hypothetical protein